MLYSIPDEGHRICRRSMIEIGAGNWVLIVCALGALE